MKREILGIIGAGNMGKSIMAGVINAGLFHAGSIMVSDVYMPGLEKIRQEYKVAVTQDSQELIKQSDVIVAALKPNIICKILASMSGEITGDKLLVSIAAGTSIESLEQAVGKDKKIIRIMPNTPVMVGEGMAALCCNANVSKEEQEFVRNLFASLGKCEIVPEALMDAVVSVSGSGPAYVFMFIEAMTDAAVLAGMPRAQAYTFAAQTVLGSAKMVLETGMHPGQLKDMVCSPGGTTIEAVRVLEEEGLRNAVIKGQLACWQKSMAMTKKSSS